MEKESRPVIIIDNNTPKNLFVEGIRQRAKAYGIDIIDNTDYLSEKRHHRLIYISPQKGFIRACPCSRKYRCCNYFTIDTIEGCIYNCEYCILKGFIDNSKILIKADTDELISELNNFKDSLSLKNLTIRIGTGELSDSLALEHIAPFAPILIEETKNKDRIILEFKTKSANVDTILNLPHNPRTTISFSISTTYLHNRLEPDTPSPSERLSAAKRCTEYSYKVGFHFDPIIFYKDYARDYEDIIRKLSLSIPGEAINWISLGTIRFNPVMLDIFTSDILFGEYITDAEKKMRYPLYIRKNIYKTISDIIRTYLGNDIKIYLCMESDNLTRIILGKSFKSNEELNRYITGS
ncbi:MAG: hypothetical protein N3B13_00505 [Deltaproteobacteria bacterium]|nr:hypothetical protein [Deltaproteobacteria bacterium]